LLKAGAGYAAATAIPFDRWSARQALAETPKVRYDAASGEGQKMLATYAKAVEMMMKQVKAGDPTSWVFQWYTHWVGGPPNTKQSEIERIYGGSPGAHRTLAESMWSTCQAHDPSKPEDNFLPWHRMFVFFLESIVRKLSGEAGFTLPYWNYTDRNLRAIPSEFQKPHDPVFASLFQSKRNPGVNANQPIDKGQPDDPLSSIALKQTTYSPVSQSRRGFNETLDNGLHGNVHVLVGNTMNMGNVPWAANDPIFWLHHCNIDRLWASWNKGGGKNPTGDWLNRSFVFADAEGQKVVATIHDFVDIDRLGYTYETFEPVTIEPQTAALVATPTKVLASAGNPARAAAASLGAGPVRIELANSSAATGNSLLANVPEIGPETRIHLVISQLQTAIQPGVLYSVYLALPEGQSGAEAEPHIVGSLNFFHAGNHGEHAEHGGEDRALSYDVTDLVHSLENTGRIGANPSVTIVPSGKPEEDATPVIGHIALIAS
jgi:tyrosinase